MHSCKHGRLDPFCLRVCPGPAHLTAQQPSVPQLPVSSTRGQQLLLLLLEALQLKPRWVVLLLRPAGEARRALG